MACSASRNTAAGPLKCVEVATGKVMWDKAGFGAGNVILAGDKVLALTDDGASRGCSGVADGIYGDQPLSSGDWKMLVHAGA